MGDLGFTLLLAVIIHGVSKINRVMLVVYSGTDYEHNISSISKGWASMEGKKMAKTTVNV